MCAHGAGNASAQSPAKPLEQIAAEVDQLLVKDKIHNRFDLLRRLQEQGLTWQPSLLAPNDLVDKLDEQGLRFYAGVKLLDALYAATFMQQQAVADSVETIEAINDKLNLRSYADLSDHFFTTLKKAAAAPESVNIEQLIDQLATDYVKDIPPLMSNPKSAEYLIDSLYGSTIETGYLMGQFYREKLPVESQLMKAVAKPDIGITEWMRTLESLFAAAGRSDETLLVDGKPVEKMALMKEIIATRKAGDISPDALKKARDSVYAQAAAIRAAMLTPAAK
jgi:hypothetical protein